MTYRLNCPFCNAEIDSDVEVCPACGALFTEPVLPELKFKDFGIFTALTVMTFGCFIIVWFILNLTTINSWATSSKDKIKLNSLIGLLFLNFLIYILFIGSNIPALGFLCGLDIIILMALTYRTLRIIQKFTLKKYNVLPEINPFYIFFFHIWYLIHFIDTYPNRVMQIHDYTDPRSVNMITLFLLFLIIQFIYCLNPATHNFYQWLFRI